ncbi:MAG: methyltransferase domain-containing protein [Bryobacteraceae bacterium]
MQEILAHLTAQDRVLDLGCARGSFPAEHTAACVVRADLAPQALSGAVACDARALPFVAQSFAAAILNHSLEHFEQPDRVLAEIGRVVRADGYLYVSVPDASTVTDRIYRWLGRGGGHVNPFVDSEALAARIARQTGLEHRATRVLHSGLSFLNRHNITGPAPRKLMLLGGGREGVIRAGLRLFRALDRRFGTRLSVYGWAFWFGPPIGVDPEPRPNVCVRCGSGHAAADLAVAGRVSGRTYVCFCGAENDLA